MKTTPEILDLSIQQHELRLAQLAAEMVRLDKIRLHVHRKWLNLEREVRRQTALRDQLLRDRVAPITITDDAPNRPLSIAEQRALVHAGLAQDDPPTHYLELTPAQRSYLSTPHSIPTSTH